MLCNVYVKVEVYIVKVDNIVIKVVYITCHQPVVVVSCHGIDLASGVKPTGLLILPVDPDSFLSLLYLFFKLGEGIWFVADPSFSLEDGSDSAVCLVSGLHFSYSEAESLNLGSILTSRLKFLARKLLFCTDIQGGSVVLNEDKG